MNCVEVQPYQNSPKSVKGLLAIRPELKFAVLEDAHNVFKHCVISLGAYHLLYDLPDLSWCRHCAV